MLVGGSAYSLTRPNTRPWAVDGVMTGALVMSSPALACAPVASMNLSKGAVEAPAMAQAMTMIPVLLAMLKEVVRSLPGLALAAYHPCGLKELSPATLVQALPLLSLTLVIASWPVFTGAVSTIRFPDDGRFTVDEPGQGWNVCCTFWMRIALLAGAVPAAAALKAMAIVLNRSLPDPWATVIVGLMAAAVVWTVYCEIEASCRFADASVKPAPAVTAVTALERLPRAPTPGMAIPCWEMRVPPFASLFPCVELPAGMGLATPESARRPAPAPGVC